MIRSRGDGRVTPCSNPSEMYFYHCGESRRRESLYIPFIHAFRGTLENQLRLLSIEVSLQRTPYMRPGALESVQRGTRSMRIRLLRLRSVLLFVRTPNRRGVRANLFKRRPRERERKRGRETTLGSSQTSGFRVAVKAGAASRRTEWEG